MITQYFPTVQEDGGSTPRDTAIVIRNLVEGRSNNKGEVELTLNSATTVLQDERLGPESAIEFMALDANAAAETLWVSNQGNFTATLNHANNALVRTFRYAIVG